MTVKQKKRTALILESYTLDEIDDKFEKVRDVVMNESDSYVDVNAQGKSNILTEDLDEGTKVDGDYSELMTEYRKAAGIE